MPGIFDSTLADQKVEVPTEEAQAMTRRLARELPSGSVVVTILCDGGERYMSEEFWHEQVRAS